MASEITVKVFKLSKKTKEAKQIRMFPADQEILNSFRDFKTKVADLFVYPDDYMDLFWKGR